MHYLNNYNFKELDNPYLRPYKQNREYRHQPIVSRRPLEDLQNTGENLRRLIRRYAKKGVYAV